jgi:hypothetical protein
MTYPYDDDLMKYDMRTHRYILTPKAMEQERGIRLLDVLNTEGDSNSSTLPDRWLAQVSQKLYTYIYQFSPQHLLIEYRLAKDPECRDLLYECLVNEAHYALKNGDFWNMAGVNLAKSTAMNIADLRGRAAVSPITESMLNRPLIDGFKLLYRGVYLLPVGKKTWREDY